MTVVLDYGVNNLRSVEKAVHHLGYYCRIQKNLDGATRLVIPGVGAFAKAMQRLGPVRAEILSFAALGNPILGICLGQQLLFDSSEEFGECKGLGIIPGKVKYLPVLSGLKVPHMGWSPIRFNQSSPICAGVADGQRFFFVHSLYCECADPTHVAARCSYGIEFPASVQSGKVWGTQFHPEKSGDPGLRILRNFLEC